MPLPSQVHVDTNATNLLVGYVQDEANFAPVKGGAIIPVDKQTNIIPKYTKHAWLRDEMRVRAPGTVPPTVDFTTDLTDSYNCQIYDQQVKVPFELDANADMPFDMKRDALALLKQKVMIKWASLWGTNIFSASLGWKDITGATSASLGGSPTEGTNAIHWSDYTNSQPIVDIDYAKGYILSQTGFEPKDLYLGFDSWNKLKNHPHIVERFKFTSRDSITTEMVAALLELDNIFVSKAVYSSSLEGTTTPTYGFAHGKHALLAYVEKSPSILKPSAFYTFAWMKPFDGGGNGLGLAVASGINEEARYNWFQSFLCIHPKLIAGDCGVFFNGIVA